jgi:hypothetical protein
VQDAVDAALDVFGDNVAFAFVGGSYARGSHRPGSDVDVFVAIKQSDVDSERVYAERLRQLHRDANLDFDHCGEIFAMAVLDQLLAFTERCIASVPAVQRSACYLADCPLSVFRKGDVVFKFIADPKTAVYDPDGLLPALEQRAAEYFRRWPMPRIQDHKGSLQLPTPSPQHRLLTTWQERTTTAQWADTPVGVGLERWFGTELPERDAALAGLPVVAVPSADPRSCPLPVASQTFAALLSAQCLAFLHTEPEGLR